MEDWETCLCFELGEQVCSHYENWCSEQDSQRWWDSLTKEEQDSFSMRLCNNCSRAFMPVDDDREQEVCVDCSDWLDNYEEFGINF